MGWLQGHSVQQGGRVNPPAHSKHRFGLGVGALSLLAGREERLRNLSVARRQTAAVQAKEVSP
jgi:hypothetical protein